MKQLSKKATRRLQRFWLDALITFVLTFVMLTDGIA